LMALFLIVGATVPFTQAAFVASMIALVILAIPSILAGGYAGVESVDPQTVDAGRAMGNTELQILLRIEIPLSLPLIIAGIRAATLQVIATTVIASYISLGGLGTIISSGIGLNDNERILGGAILVTALALVVDGVLAVLQRLVTRRGSTGPRPHTKNVRRRSLGSTAVAIMAVDERKEYADSKK
ncbi:MAG: ABC transporter permease subunit, partial [Pontimonas sp.]